MDKDKEKESYFSEGDVDEDQIVNPDKEARRRIVGWSRARHRFPRQLFVSSRMVWDKTFHPEYSNDRKYPIPTSLEAFHW